MTNGNGQDLVTLSIDGKEVTVPKGTLIIRAAEELGIEIPRFCDHPLLDPVAACRQCYVKVEGQRKLMTSCSTPVADGLVVHTQFTDDEVKKAQVSVLEYLLINHPLDCPVCDRGGECPLQDQALAFGPGESRYTEAKRTYRKPLPLSPLVALDRERCVLCARCTRFCDEISGDRFIELFDRGAAQQVSIAPGEDFKSPFSGNTIQICPVGALTATTYRFAARPFDLKSGDSICPHCASGCNIRVDLRRGEVVRHLARDNYDVNDAWLCDKGRFAFSFPDDANRLTTPLLREPGLEPVSFAEALSTIAGWCKDKRVAVLAGGRLSDEDAYALSKLTRTAFQTNDVDHRVSGGDPGALPAEQVQAADMPVTYQDVERAKAIVVVGLDAEQELPILHLRILKAVRKSSARVFVIHPRRTRLWEVAEHILCRPGDEAALLSRIGSETNGDSGEAATIEARVASVLREAGEGGVVFGGPGLLESEGAVEAARTLAEATGARFALLCRRANDRGALRAGLHPALLPGGRVVDDDAQRSVIEVAWGTLLPNRRGRDTREIIEAAANKELDVLFLVGVDPLRDFPNASLVQQALQNVQYKVVVDISSDAMQIYADAMLPGAPYLEKDGHYTDWEGRPQRLRAVRPPVGLARSEWEIFQELSEAMGADMGFHSLDQLHEEMARVLASPEVGIAPRGHSPPFPTLRDASPAPPAAATTDGDLVLFTYPLLVDEGTLSKGADLLKEALEEPAFVEVNTADAERLGVADGERATVRTDGGEATLPVRVTPHIAAGTAFIPFNQPGFAVSTLLPGRLVTRATVEPVKEKVTA
ncbi:MAG TPA: NADH-quinone oxidoreductase subunit G [Actinomycetota bacterium]|nr:NADH-quinone oxidoreductase subunit G [Actinomycetota bacterium]